MSFSHNPGAQLGRRAFLAATTALGAAALVSCASSGQSGGAADMSTFASIDDWIAREAIPFSLQGDAFDAAVDSLMAKLGDQVTVLGFGEPMHSGEEFLVIRNRIFQRLVEAHGYRAITIENNDMRTRLADDYVAGRGTATWDDIKDTAFSVGIGGWEANRELIEWIKAYNANPANRTKINLYGTLASDQETTKSPRQTVELALAYLQRVDAASAAQRRQTMEPLLGADADWEGPATARAMEIMQRVLAGETTPPPPQPDAIGLSPRAQAVRQGVDSLAAELESRRAEFVARTDADSFGEAMRHLTVARNLLDLHAAAASGSTLDTMVSMRDAMAGEHMRYITEREQSRGKVMMFLHSIHLRRTRARLPWYEFLPTGAHLDQMLGPRFAVVAGAVGVSAPSFIEAPAPDTLEGKLLARQTDCFLPLWRARRFPEGALAALPERSGPARPYIPYTQLIHQSLLDYDALCFVQNVGWIRGLAPMPG